jgi:hypothetical protein
MYRPDTPRTSVATDDYLMLASSRKFWTRLATRVLSPTNWLRWRGDSFMLRRDVRDRLTRGLEAPKFIDLHPARRNHQTYTELAPFTWFWLPLGGIEADTECL